MTELRHRNGTFLDDGAALLEMARSVLRGPSDDGRSTYQIALTVCAPCGAARQDASGDPVSVPSEVIEMANCDAQHMAPSTSAQRTTPPALRQQPTPRTRRTRTPTWARSHEPSKTSRPPRVAPSNTEPLHRGKLNAKPRATDAIEFQHPAARRTAISYQLSSSGTADGPDRQKPGCTRPRIDPEL
jgi:hypothetical protein